MRGARLLRIALALLQAEVRGQRQNATDLCETNERLVSVLI